MPSSPKVPNPAFLSGSCRQARAQDGGAKLCHDGADDDDDECAVMAQTTSQTTVCAVMAQEQLGED